MSIIKNKCIKLNISVGKSRLDSTWKNQIITWETFVQKIKDPIITNETQSQYQKMTKNQQSQIKDVGGFIGGHLKNGKRGSKNILNRSLITLDVDNPSKNFLNQVKNLFKFVCIIYATHSYTKEKPRYRWVIPLTAPIEPDMYQALARYLASIYNLENFDSTTFQPDRLMYWSSHSKDVQKYFIYEKTHPDFPYLNPEDFLGKIGNWQDCASWKSSDREYKSAIHDAKKHKNPKEKNNIVGAFCRVYGIEEAISKYLFDVYEKGDMEDRYTYIKGTSSNGLIVFEDIYAYSHHSTDPINGRAVNAFDLVRIHKFSHLDKNMSMNTPIVKYPSYKAMSDLALEDELVEEEIRKSSAEEIVSLSDLNNIDDVNWVKNLEVNKSGKPISNSKNMALIFQKDKNLGCNIRFDEFENNIIINSDLPWRKKHGRREWNDRDDLILRGYIEKTYGIRNKYLIEQEFALLLENNTFHSVKEYLSGLKWDGTSRLDTLLIDYLGAEDNIYTRAVSRKMMVGAIARVIKPGIKFDYAAVIIGPQGIGKSMLLAKLGGQWYKASLAMLNTKDAKVELQGSWIIELAEMSSLTGVNIEKIKEFITITDDKFRMPYGKRTIRYKRQCVFWGTSNTPGLLKDRTGNRRFLPVDVGVNKPKLDIKKLSKSTIDLIWAEAVQKYYAGELLVLNKGEEAKAEEMRSLHTEVSALEGQIVEYLDIPITDDWYEKSVYERKQYIANYHDGLSEKGNIIRNRVCVIEVWFELLNGNKKDLDTKNYKRIQNILSNLKGWKRYKKSRGRLKFGKDYGLQTAYLRVKN